MPNRKPEEEMLEKAATVMTKYISKMALHTIENIGDIISSINTPPQDFFKEDNTMPKEPIVVHRFVADSEGDTESYYTTQQITGDSVVGLLAELSGQLSMYEGVDGWQIVNVTISWQEDDYLANVVLRQDLE